MSFSSGLKKEICSNRPFIYGNKKAVCFGLTLFGRSFDEKSMAIFTENQAVSRLYATLIYELVEIKTSITATEQILGDNRKLYEVTVDTMEDRLQVLRFFAPVYARFSLCVKENPKDLVFLRGVLCGAFLSCANISDPRKSYHLEFVVHNETAMESMERLLQKLGLHFGRARRKGVCLYYIKSSEEIEDVLTMLGAGKSALEVMNVKIYKDMRNKVNRVTNCETANIDRTVFASSAQTAQIRLIEKTIGIQALPENLRQIAALRLENPDLPLSELAQMLTPALSRSGAHYRLRQIGAVAQEITDRLAAEKNKRKV